MLPQETYSYAYTLKQERAEKRRYHAHSWIYGSRVGAWLGPFSVLQYATADGCGGQRPGNRRKEDRVNTTTCMPGTYHKKIFDDEKAMLIPTQIYCDIRCGQQQIKRLYARNFMMLASKGQPVGASVNFLFSEKASLSKWPEIRVLQIEKISIARLKDVVVLTQLSRDDVVYRADRKKWSINALEFLVFVRA